MIFSHVIFCDRQATEFHPRTLSQSLLLIPVSYYISHVCLSTMALLRSYMFVNIRGYNAKYLRHESFSYDGFYYSSPTIEITHNDCPFLRSTGCCLHVREITPPEHLISPCLLELGSYTSFFVFFFVVVFIEVCHTDNGLVRLFYYAICVSC